MKTPSSRILLILVISATLLAACNMPATSIPTTNPGLEFTQAAETAAANPTGAPATLQPTAGITQVLPSPTLASSPTETATATPLPSQTPTASVTHNQAECSNQAEFISDVTVPDNTEFLPGEQYIKTWQLKNSGSCTWGSGYALQFVSGDQMNGTSPMPITGLTAPGATLDVSVSLKAPGTSGTYQGNWELRAPNGTLFGTGSHSDQPFYVLIKVVEGVSELNLGAATWTDSMDNADNWYLLDTANTKFSEGDGVLVMKSLHAGGGEEWDISTRPSMNDYYLQATFITGDTCSGLDRYGLLARAPDPAKGYVFEFSCDGHYRLYTWDGKNYNALQEWQSAASIKVGTKQTNVMGIWMKGSTIRLYANGHKLAEFTDSTFDHGQFGLVVGSINTDNLTISVDKVEYWKFDQ